MSSQPTSRCPHFQLHSEPLAFNGPQAYLAIRHCLLTERLLRLLEPLSDARPLTQRLMIRATDERAYGVVGPDLEAVTQPACTHDRCHQQCTPAYRQLLEFFDVDDPNIERVTCDEETAETSDYADAQAQAAPSL